MGMTLVTARDWDWLRNQCAVDRIPQVHDNVLKKMSIRSTLEIQRWCEFKGSTLLPAKL